MNKNINNNTFSRVLAVLFILAAVVGGVFYIEDRVAAKVNKLETRLAPKINKAQENKEILIRIEEQVKVLNERVRSCNCATYRKRR